MPLRQRNEPEGSAIFDTSPSGIQRQMGRAIERAINPPKVKVQKPMPRIVDEAYEGDPFLKLIEFDGSYYVLNEAAMIEYEVTHPIFLWESA